MECSRVLEAFRIDMCGLYFPKKCLRRYLEKAFLEEA